MTLPPRQRAPVPRNKSKFYKYLGIEAFKLPGREVLLFRATWREPRSDEHRRTREKPLPPICCNFREPVTLPSQGRVTGPPEPPGALSSLSNTILISSLRATDRREETSSYLAICGSQKFESYLDRGFPPSCPEERSTLPGQLGESLDLMNIVERERSSSFEGGPVTLPLPG